MALPYATANRSDNALTELQKVLAKFGCQSFGTMIDVENGMTIVQFKWRGRSVSLQASWKGYAQAWLKDNPYTARKQCTRAQHEAQALEQGKKSVRSVLRDWVKGQVTAIECGVISFEAAFAMHMLLPTGERVLDRIQADKLLPAPVEEAV